IAAGIAAFTGHLASVVGFAKSMLYPTLPELVLRDSRFVEIQGELVSVRDSFDSLRPHPYDVFNIVVETVIEKKGGPGVEGCNAELLSAENKLRIDTRNDPQVHDYSFRAGSEQKKIEFHFGFRRKELTKEAKLRIVCKDIITSWSPVSGIPDQK